MESSKFFGLEGYHVAMAAIGAGIIIAYWIPRFFSGREPAASALLISAGALAFSFIPGMPAAIDPRTAPRLWELTSELAVIVALFGTGLRIDNLRRYESWRPTVRLLAVVMPLTILSVALLGWLLAGMTLAGALLLGAVLAPTDPVLAGDVQVGPPTEGGEHPVRFSLTAEAGLNDGLAFPFVYLALIIAAEGFAPGSWGVKWLLLDVLYRIAVGVAAGAALGWLLGRILFAVPKGNALADTGSGVLALAGILLCYGATELIEGYGFIAAFVAGLALRRAEAEHEFHGTLHGFTQAIEHALTAILLILIGSVLPLLWPELDWKHVTIALVLLLVIRPGIGWLGLAGTDLLPRERAVVAAYGVRGIGSIYYLGYATSHIELVNEGQLWATIALTIALSTLLHGLTAGAAVERVTREERRAR
jgi:NhaP-type Na+/H+ or K+/H+ antiporter